VRSNPPPDFVNVGDQCALIAKAFRTLIRFSALGHKEEPIRSISVSFVAVCGETLCERIAYLCLVGNGRGVKFSREGLREYVSGALWVWPGVASVIALIAGLLIGKIIIGPESPLAPLAFQGTADDARGLLSIISTTVVTVIALVLGLTVVALQPASTQFSTAHPEALLPLASRYGVSVAVLDRIGEHVIAGTPLALMWPPAATDPVPDADMFARALDEAVDIGFERTLQQDITFGMRQLVDVACKALSPAINDPYTAVQAIDHLSVIFCAMAIRPLGDDVARDPNGVGMVLVPGRRFGEYLAVLCGMIRRYGASEPIVSQALLRLLRSCAAVVGDDPARRAAIERQVALIVLDAEREIAQPDDLLAVRAAAQAIGYPEP
jgi:uncharacterized membrane protein